MAQRPTVVVFDVVETLFSLRPVEDRMRLEGLLPGSLQLWFARTLRDGLALQLTGRYRPFREVAAGALEALIGEHGFTPTKAQVEKILAGLSEPEPQPDAGPALQRLKAAGLKVAALTNSSRESAAGLLRAAGLDRSVDKVLSAHEVGRWKPAREPYLYAARECRAQLRELALVSVHSWDIHGAKCAGLTAAWVSRLERHPDPALEPADIRAGTLPEAADRLLRLPEAALA